MHCERTALFISMSLMLVAKRENTAKVNKTKRDDMLLPTPIINLIKESELTRNAILATNFVYQF